MMSTEMQGIVTKCLVCNARNAKQHYGSWCCNGCKGFFWRTVSSKRRYICLNSDNAGNALFAKCEIQDGRRNSCRACRLKRCLDVGMDPNLIRDSWGKSTALKQRNSAQMVEQQQHGLHQSSSSTMDVKQIKHESSPNRDWEDGIRSRSSSNGSTVSGGANNCLAMPGANQSMNVQLLTEYLEWIQTVPELKMFSEQDKNLLILNRARPSGWLILANQSLHGQQQQNQQIGNGRMDVLESEILKPLRDLNVSKLEFELLRLVCFFNTVPQMSAECRQMVQAIQSTYMRSLSEFALKQSLQMPGNVLLAADSCLTGAVHRISQVTHLLAVVEKIGNQYG